MRSPSASVPALVAGLAKPKLLIVDELGYLPFEPGVAYLFFQLASRHYERGSILITSNPLGWHHPRPVAPSSQVITTRGDGHRLREKRRFGPN